MIFLLQFLGLFFLSLSFSILYSYFYQGFLYRIHFLSDVPSLSKALTQTEAMNPQEGQWRGHSVGEQKDFSNTKEIWS